MRTFAVACAALALALFVAGAFAVWDGEWGAVRHAHGSELVSDIEGRRGLPGNRISPTRRGFPTRSATASSLPHHQDRGRAILLRHRLEIGMTRCIAERWPPWRAASAAVQGRPQATRVLFWAATGLLEFTNALSALARRDYAAAAQAFRENEEGEFRRVVTGSARTRAASRP